MARFESLTPETAYLEETYVLQQTEVDFLNWTERLIEQRGCLDRLHYEQEKVLLSGEVFISDHPFGLMMEMDAMISLDDLMRVRGE